MLEYAPEYAPEYALEYAPEYALEYTNGYATEHTTGLEVQVPSEAEAFESTAENEQFVDIDEQSENETSDSTDLSAEPIVVNSRICDGEKCIFCHKEGLLQPETSQSHVSWPPERIKQTN